MLSGLFKKRVPLINPEDSKELREIERVAYLEEAKKLVAERGKKKAQDEIGPVIKKDTWAN
jgi:hypothetical protein